MWQVGFIFFFLICGEALAKNPSRSSHDVGISVRGEGEVSFKKRPKEEGASFSAPEQKELETLLNRLLEEISHLNSGRKLTSPTN